MLKKFQVMPSEIGSCEADQSEFDAPTEGMSSVMPLLYQSGYITVKRYDPETELYTLDIPNKEIRVGLYRSLATVPYCNNVDSEGHYQQMMYVIFSILDNYVDVEVRTPSGRVDMVLRTATHLYLFELKLNKDADAAMKQIDLKEYPKRFALSGLPIVKVGVNFDVATHNITDWKIEAE